MKSWGTIIRAALLGIGAGCHTSDVYSVNLQCETRKRRRKREAMTALVSATPSLSHFLRAVGHVYMQKSPQLY